MKQKKWLILIGVTFIALFGIVGVNIRESRAASSSYKILAWNDLGMHCYNRDFADMAVLPPYNTLWVQVVKVGDPPEVVTSGFRVEYFYQDNTYSVGKTNFWSYDQALFGVDLPLNVGLKGKGLSGTMNLNGDYFIAEGIPITEFSDSAPTVRQPYQLATVVLKDSTTSEVLTSIQVVTPTSSEMRCDNCHSDTGIAAPEFPTGKVETNILQLHDEEAGTFLMASRPVLCAKCHGSNALGIPGNTELKNLSNSMHEKHSDVSPNTLTGCYNCHPGPQTQCLRDVMSTQKGMTCIDCHGGMAKVSTNPNPWLNEPRCDTCHNTGQYNQDQALYRFSKEHGGLYCEACHDSTHAIAPSREGNDAIKFNQLQGKNGPIEECSVCHSVSPVSGEGPHGITVPTFGDVPTTHMFWRYIEGFYNAGITVGCSQIPKLYCPDNPVTRGEMAVFIERALGNFAPTPSPSGMFTDVPYPSLESFTPFIEQYYNDGLTVGCSQSPLKYCPQNNVTRGEMAVFIERALGDFAPTPSPTGMFTDVPYPGMESFTPFIEQFYNDGITVGCSQSPLKYCPQNNVTRGEMAVFIVRAFGIPLP